MTNQSYISIPAAIAIGIGGMIGAGIFSILGVVANTAGAAMWISFFDWRLYCFVLHVFLRKVRREISIRWRCRAISV